MMTCGINATIDALSQIAELSMAKGEGQTAIRRARTPLRLLLPNLNLAKAQSLRDEHH
jgi:hypothetical protein